MVKKSIDEWLYYQKFGMEVIPIDSPPLTVFALSGGLAYARNRHMKMSENGLVSVGAAVRWFSC